MILILHLIKIIKIQFIINRNGHWKILTGYLGPKTDKKTETITWTSALPSQTGRQRRCDVITEQISCLKGAARNIISEEDCFDLFFSDDMFELITSNTNKRIDDHLDKLRTFKEDRFNSSKYTWLKQTTNEEMKAFTGLVYFRGLYSMNHCNIELLFKSGIGPDIFSATISQQRMRFLLAHITFDDKSTRKDRYPSYRFPTGRYIFEMFNKNCSNYVIPSEYLAINETFYPMMYQIAFRL